MRNYFKMTPKMTGVLIKRINPLSSSYGILKKDDVLLSIDGVSIGNDETGKHFITQNFVQSFDSVVKIHPSLCFDTVVFRKTESIDFNHLVSMKKPCETTILKVLRDGKTHEFNINITPVS